MSCGKSAISYTYPRRRSGLCDNDLAFFHAFMLFRCLPMFPMFHAFIFHSALFALFFQFFFVRSFFHVSFLSFFTRSFLQFFFFSFHHCSNSSRVTFSCLTLNVFIMFIVFCHIIQFVDVFNFQFLFFYVGNVPVCSFFGLFAIFHICSFVHIVHHRWFVVFPCKNCQCVFPHAAVVYPSSGYL